MGRGPVWKEKFLDRSFDLVGTFCLVITSHNIYYVKKMQCGKRVPIKSGIEVEPERLCGCLIDARETEVAAENA
jgi:hypothetical protein